MDNKTYREALRKRLYQFVLRLLKLADSLPKNSTTKVVGDQLIRSGTSILANYIEAQAAGSRKEFSNFLRYSLKSSNEAAVWFLLLRDTGNGSPEEIEYLLGELDEISRILASSLLKLKQKP